MARPSKFSQSTLIKLKEAFLFGASDREACLYAGICRDTLYDYQKKNTKFSDQKKEWKSNPLLKARKTIFDNLDKHTVAMWYLERKARTEFDLKRNNIDEDKKMIVVRWTEEKDINADI
jgi:hypothetical protein